MSALRQFGALLWKNVVVRKRTPIILVLEILWPIIIFVGAVLMRHGSPPTEHDTCSYPERSFPSSGMVPFLQSSVCTINNECKTSQHIQERQTAQAKLQSLVADLGPLLEKSTTLEAIRALPTVNVILKGLTNITDGTDMGELDDKLKLSSLFRDPEQIINILSTKYSVLTEKDARELMNSTLNVVKLLEIGGAVDFKDIVCNPDQLQQYIIFSQDSDVSLVSRDLCAIQDDMISTITNDLMRHLDVANIIRVWESLANMTGEFDMGVLLDDVANLIDVSMKTGLANLLDLDGVSSVMRTFAGFLPDLTDLGDVDFERISELFSVVEPMLGTFLNDTMLTDTIGQLIQAAANMTDAGFDIEKILGELLSLTNGTNIDPSLEAMMGGMAGMDEILPFLNGLMNSSSQTMDDMGIENIMVSMETMMMEVLDEPTMNMMMVMGETMMDMVDDTMDYYIDMNTNLETTLVISPLTEPAMQTLLAAGTDTASEFLTTVVTAENMYNVMSGDTNMQTVCVEAAEPLLRGQPSQLAMIFRQSVCNPTLTADIDKAFDKARYQDLVVKMNSTMNEIDLMMKGTITRETNMTMADMVQRMNNTLMKMGNSQTNMMDVWLRMFPNTALPEEAEDMWFKLGDAYFVQANLYTTVIMVGESMESSSMWSSVSRIVQMTDSALHAATLFFNDLQNMTGPGSKLGEMLDHLPYIPELLTAVYNHVNMSTQDDAVPKSDIMTLVCVDLSSKDLSQGADNIRRLLCDTNWVDYLPDLMLTFDPLRILANVEVAFNQNFDTQKLDWFRMQQNVEYMVTQFSNIEQFSIFRVIMHLLENVDGMFMSLETMNDILSHLTIEQMLSNQWMFDLIDTSMQEVPMWTAIKHVMRLDGAAGRVLQQYLKQSQDKDFSLTEYVSHYSPTLGAHLSNMTSATPELMETITKQFSKPQEILARLLSVNYSALCIEEGSITSLLGLKDVSRAVEFERDLCDLDWDMIMKELYMDPDLNITLSELELLLMTDLGSLPPVALSWSDVVMALNQTADLSSSLGSLVSPDLLGLNMSLGNLSSILTGLENVDMTELLGSLDSLMTIFGSENDSMLAGLADLQKQYTYLSYHFLTFANNQLRNFNNMTHVDIEEYLNSEEMNKIFTVMQDSSAINHFIMENLKVYMEDQAKISQIWMVDFEALCVSSSPVFGELFTVPAKSNMTLSEIQEQICGVNLNATKLFEELSLSLDGFGDFVMALAGAENMFSAYMENENTQVSYETLSKLVEENIELITSLATCPPTFKLPLPDLEDTMVQLEQQLTELMAYLNTTYAPIMNGEMASLEQQVFQALVSVQASSPEADQFLQVGQTYLRVLAQMSHQLQDKVMNPASGSTEYPEMRRVWSMVEQLPEVLSTLLYNMISDSEKVSSFVEGIMTGTFCVSDPSDLLTVPDTVDLDLGDLIQRVCALNATALSEEMMELSQTQMISDMYAGLANTTETANLTDIMINAQRLATQISEMMNMTEQVPRFLNAELWAQTLSTLETMAVNSSMEDMSSIQDQVMAGLLGLQTSTPQLKGVFNVLSIYVHVVQAMVDNGIALSLNPIDGLADYPETTKVWGLLQFLPEVFQTLVYTANNDNSKISTFIEASMSGMEGLCARNPDDLMTVPPGSTFSFAEFFNTFCSINLMGLEMEYQNMSNTQAISEAYNNLWNSTTGPDMMKLMESVEKLMTSVSQNITLPRVFSDSVWMEALEVVGQFLMNSSSAAPQNGSSTDMSALFAGMEGQVLATMDAVMDLFIAATDVSSGNSTMSLDAEEMITVLQALVNVTYLTEDAAETNTINHDKMLEVFSNPDLLVSLCEGKTFSQYITLPAANPTIAEHLEKVICVRPQHLAELLRQSTNLGSFEDKIMDIWFNNATTVDLEKFGQNIETIITMFVTPTREMTADDIGTLLINFLSAVSTRPLFISSLEEALNPLSFNGDVQILILQANIAVEMIHKLQVSTEGLDDPENVVKLMSMMTNSDELMETFTRISFIDSINFYGQLPAVAAAVCSPETLAAYAPYYRTSYPLTDLATILCGVEGNLWYNTLASYNFTLMDISTIQEMFRQVSGEHYFRSWKQITDAMLSIAKSVSMMNMSSIEDFVEDIVPALESNQQLLLDNSKNGVLTLMKELDSGGLLDDVKGVMEIVLAVEKFLYSQLQTATDANQTVTLTDVLPNSEALAHLLQSMVSPDTATAIMVATLHPEEFIGLVLTNGWDATMCNKTAFLKTFTFPEGVDPAQVQADLCGLSSGEKAQLEILLNQIDTDQFLKELQLAITNGTTSDNVWHDVMHYGEMIIEQVMSIGNIDSSNLDSWLHPIIQALETLGDGGNTAADRETCQIAVDYLQQTSMFSSVKPLLDTMTNLVAVSNVFLSVDLDLNSAVCYGNYDNLSSLVQRFNNDLLPQKLQWIAEKFMGDTDDISFSCETMVSSVNGLTLHLSTAFNLLFNETTPSIVDCVADTLQASEGLIEDLSKLFTFGNDMLQILSDPNLKYFLETVTGSPEIMSMIEEFINTANQQQDVLKILEESLQRNLTTIASFFEESFNVGQQTLNSLLNLTDIQENVTAEAFVEGICGTDLVDTLATSNDTSELVASLCGSDKQVATQVADYLMQFTQLTLQLQNETLDPNQFWTDLTSDLSELFSKIEGLTELASVLNSLQNFDISSLGNSGELLRTMQILLTDNGPDALLESFNKVLDNFDDPANSAVISDMRMMADGLFAFKSLRLLFIDNIQIKDLVKDPAALHAYLTGPVALDTRVADAIVDGSLSFEMLLNSSQQDVTDWVCNSTNLAYLLETTDKGVDPEYISEQFCSLDKQTVTQILEEVLQQLDIGSLVEDVVTNSLMSTLRANNITMEDSKTSLLALQAANTDLKMIVEQFDNYTASIPNAVASLASAQKGSTDTATLSALLCGDNIPEVTDEFQIVDNLPSEPTLTEAQHREMDELPHEACKTMYKDIMSTREGPIVWGYLKPLLMGRILYTPNTPAVQKLMAEVNSTFSEIADVMDIVTDWVEGTVVLGDLTTRTSKIEELLESPIVKGLVSQVAGMSAEELEDMLYTFDGTDSGVLEGLSNGAGMLVDYVKCLNLNRMVAVDSEQQLEQEAEKYNKKNEFLAGIVFEDMNVATRKRRAADDTLPPHVIYKIRMDIDNVRQSNRIKDRFWRPRPDDDFAMKLRYLRGFLQLQDMIDSSIISLQTGITDHPHVATKQFPFPCHKMDSFVNAFSAYLLPVMMTLAMVAGISISVNILVYDRENGQEETLKAMGMKAGLTWWAWFIITFLIMAFVAFLQTIILRYGNIFIYSNMLIIFLYFLDFIFSTLMMVYFVSAFFTRKSLAILATLIVYFISYLPFIVLLTMEVEMKFWQKFLACLSSTTAFSFSSQYIARFEEQQVGMQWGNVKDSPITADDFSFYWSCMLMLIDGAIYLVLGWYVRTVKPGKYGVGAPWYFPVCPSYWGCWSPSAASSGRPNDYFSEGAVSDHPVAMSVRGLTKKYSDKTLAVKGLNMDIYCGQVTTLLGHNGAAKTTTMHMLSGILEPTKGEVNIFNRPVRNMKTSIGICPQHNALFDFMTVKEHMELYSKVKSSSMFHGSSAKDDIKQLLQEVDLWYCRHSLVKDLSGGMQRRLCVALAFVGGTRVVILDEPTSGVDPSGRRAIWNLILRRKAGVGILLSTHHLDEADMISDRVAILHQGSVLCEGSPLFLKQNLATGHRLMVVGDQTPQGSDPAPLLSLLQRFVPRASLQQLVGCNMTFVLPSHDVSRFSQLFKDIEANQQALHIVSFGITDPTLEEVFLRTCSAADHGRIITPDTVKGVADMTPTFIQDDETKKTIDTIESDSGNSMNMRKCERETGCGLALQQFAALLVKRFHHFRRNWRMLLTMLLLPLVLFLVANALYIIRPEDSEAPSKMLSTAMYGPDTYVFSKMDSTDQLASAIQNSFMQYPGLGSSCIPGVSLGSPYECVKPDTSFSKPSTSMAENRTCKCEDHKYTCEGHLTPAPQRVTPTTEILQDLEGRDIETYLLKSFTDFIEKRYGGFSFHDDADKLKALVWFNNKGHHALPAFYNAYSNGLLRSLMSTKYNGPVAQFGISVYNHPFLFNKQQLSAETLLQNAVDAGIAVVVLLAFTFIPVGALMYIVNENISREKHLQFVSGVGSLTYWLAHLIWDLFIVAIAVAIAYGVLAIFQHDSFWERNNATAVVCLLLLYCWSTLPLVYCMSKLFKSASTAFFTLFCTLIFIGITTMMTMFTLNFFKGDDTSMGEAQNICGYAFLIFPPYALGGGLIDMITNQVTTSIFERFNTDAYVDPFSLDLIGWNMIAMAIEGLVFFIIVLLLELNISCQSNRIPDYPSDTYEDADVTMERMRVQNGQNNQDMITVNNLHKVYVSGGREVHAVNGLTFGVAGNQCFGLLGVNGAGKTTTFNMLTGAIQPNKGSAMLLGKSLKEGSTNLGHNMGYCPQDEAVDPFLSVEEMLFFHAKLKGLQGDDRKQAVTKVIENLQLGAFKDKVVRACSGGMKRKLSLAIALLGDPPLMLLDEPTSGMDPKAKRLVWNCLMGAKTNDQAIILTSHSMEECDNLCDQIGIMVNGEFKCLGSSQHLKQKYGQGYTLTLNIVGLSTSKSRVYELIQQHFPGATLKDQHRNVVQVDLPRSSMQVSDIYEVLEREKEAYNILFYSVTQTTLDTVFLNFAQEQTDNTSVEECSTDSSSDQNSSDAPTIIIPKSTAPSYAYTNSAYSSMDKTMKPYEQWNKPSTYM